MSLRTRSLSEVSLAVYDSADHFILILRGNSKIREKEAPLEPFALDNISKEPCGNMQFFECPSPAVVFLSALFFLQCLPSKGQASSGELR